MSYMSGMMMGLAFGKGIRQLFKGGVPGCAAKCAPKCATPAFALARAIPGRRRYYAKALLGNEALAKALEESLTKLDFVDEVKANPVSGSLLLVYHGDEVQMDAVAKRLADRVFSVPARKEDADAPTPFEEAADELAAFGRHIHGTFSAINRHMKLATNGWFDLPSLLSLLFTVRGLQKILVTKQLPTGPQLIWWAFSILRGWRFA
ncbi:MAG: hypothetical protein II880_03785 [Schwartzia sp.]|nr:hypothetical protein [Schwartzia sp. (in: firmicutes)]